MKMKRFYAADIRQVMQMVKDELGEDAVIMSNRSVDGGVEIVAAKDFDEQAIQEKVRDKPVIKKNEGFQSLASLAKTSPKAAIAKKPHVVSSSRKSPESSSLLKNPNIQRKLDEYAGYAEKTFVPKVAPARTQRPNVIKKDADNRSNDIELSLPPIKKGNELVMEDKPDNDNFQETLEQIKESLGSATEEMFQKMRMDMRKEMRYLRTVMDNDLLDSDEAVEGNPIRLELLSRLADIGLSQKLSIKIANRLNKHLDSDVVWEKALEMLHKVLPVMDKDIITDGGVISLVGPTGVGKTTTIAKLAAQYILKQGSSEHVVMITMDNYRIGAHEQLSIYGRILDVPVRVAADGDELRKLIDGFKHKRLILIDTAGVSQKDVRMLDQIESLNNSGVAVKRYLVMSATTQLKSMSEIIEGFEPDACILTKMDESAETGNAISALIEYQVPLAFMTDGQEVPEDIHHANANELIKKCLSESKRVSDTNYLEDEEWRAANYA